MTSTVFLDSDIIISSLISNTGAAHLILHTPKLKLFISNYSKKELESVVSRLRINSSQLAKLVQTLTVTNIDNDIPQIKIDYQKYVSDIDDAHILAGAVNCKARFLVTYNLKHYKVELIKRELGIIVLTPALYLQYIRSLK